MKLYSLLDSKLTFQLKIRVGNLDKLKKVFELYNFSKFMEGDEKVNIIFKDIIPKNVLNRLEKDKEIFFLCSSKSSKNYGIRAWSGIEYKNIKYSLTEKDLGFLI